MASLLLRVIGYWLKTKLQLLTMVFTCVQQVHGLAQPMLTLMLSWWRLSPLLKKAQLTLTLALSAQ